VLAACHIEASVAQYIMVPIGCGQGRDRPRPREGVELRAGQQIASGPVSEDEVAARSKDAPAFTEKAKLVPYVAERVLAPDNMDASRGNGQVTGVGLSEGDLPLGRQQDRSAQTGV
jgi:hypothetical protein